MINDEIIINGEGFQLENRRYTLLYKKKKKKKMNTRLAFSIFKYLIDKMKHEKGKN